MNWSRIWLLIANPNCLESSCRPTPRKFSGRPLSSRRPLTTLIERMPVLSEYLAAPAVSVTGYSVGLSGDHSLGCGTRREPVNWAAAPARTVLVPRLTGAPPKRAVTWIGRAVVPALRTSAVKRIVAGHVEHGSTGRTWTAEKSEPWT